MINPGDIKVLIAEDEPDLRDLLAAKFRVFGFDVETAHSGSNAWDKLLTNKDIQIVISDIRMPNGTGYDLLRKCKERDAVFPRVFLISGFTDYTEKELFEMGAEGFISKPFDTKILLNVVRKSLLQTSDRWRTLPSEVPAQKLTYSTESIEAAMRSGEFGVGRGGIFLTTHETPVDLGSMIEFEIKSDNWNLVGFGNIRWNQKSKNGNQVGIEIASLSGPSFQEFLDWIETQKPQSYIPTPQ